MGGGGCLPLQCRLPARPPPARSPHLLTQTHQQPTKQNHPNPPNPPPPPPKTPTSSEQAHLGILEGSAEDAALLVTGLHTLIGVSYVDETEVFKTCLDYWNFFVPEVSEVLRVCWGFEGSGRLERGIWLVIVCGGGAADGV